MNLINQCKGIILFNNISGSVTVTLVDKYCKKCRIESSLFHPRKINFIPNLPRFMAYSRVLSTSIMFRWSTRRRTMAAESVVAARAMRTAMP